MKFKFKFLATAAALALSSVSAFATINVSTNPDLLFVAYDGSGATGATYVRDLGSLSQLGANNLTFGAPSASIFGTQFTGVAASNIYWNVFALDNTSPNVFLTGSVSAQNAQNLGAFDVTSVASVLTGTLGGLTQLDVAANGYIKPNGEYTGSANAADQTNGNVLTTNFQFALAAAGKGVGTNQNFLEVSGVDGSVSQLFQNAALTGSAAVAGNVNGGYFTLADAAGDLTWTNLATVGAVPLPAGALLFAPGLLGLFGIGRRRGQA